MSTSDVRYPAASGSTPPSFGAPYESSLPNPPGDIENTRQTRCATGVRFLTTIHGLLNIITIVGIEIVVLCATIWVCSRLP